MVKWSAPALIGDATSVGAREILCPTHSQ